MSLFAKLVGPRPVDEDKIPIHAFMFWLRLWQQGERTRAEIIAEFELITADEAELDAIKNKFDNSTDKLNFFREVKDMLYAGESRHGFTTLAEFITRLNRLP